MEKENVVQLSEGELTNEALEEYKERVGLSLRITGVFNQTVSYEAIRNFVNGIGDSNPLYRDKEYAKKSRYGALIAPPNWLYSIFPTWVSHGLPGLHGWHAGNDWEFYKPIYINDYITPKCIQVGFDVKESRMAGRSIINYERAEFYNQRGELVAKAPTWSVKAERKASREKGKYSQIKLPHPWTDKELAKIEEEVLAEKERGSEVRYWEDTEVGEELPTMIKGPFGLTDIIAFCVGAGPILIAAHGVMLRNYRRHPAWAFRDPDTFALEPVYAVHYNKRAAQGAGLPYPYDVGTQRQCWLINSITNWMGDEGWLKRSYAEYRRFVYFSDVVWFKAKITNKYVDENEECCLDIESHGINQREEDTVVGFSTVILPSRERGTWPVAKRLPAPEFRGSGK